MNEKDAKPVERRDFFRSVIRTSALAALGLAGGSAILKRLSLGEDCINLGICRSCRVFESCGLPAALSAKEAKRTGKQNRISSENG